MQNTKKQEAASQECWPEQRPAIEGAAYFHAQDALYVDVPLVYKAIVLFEVTLILIVLYCIVLYAAWRSGCTYFSPAPIFCDWCMGARSNFSRRTWSGILFVPFLFVVLMLLFLEAAFWMLVACGFLVIFLVVVAVFIGLSAGSTT